MHILLVDDDAELCGLLGEFLTREGFTVECAHDGTRGLERALAPGVDLVLLDVMLPGMDGFEILRRLRPHSKIPVMMLTARGEDVDRIVGLELGADDYLPKPCSPRELLARIRAVLRRRQEPRSAEGPPGAGCAFAGWRLDLVRRELRSPQGVVVNLSSGEFSLLRAFVERPQRVLTRDRLLNAVWGLAFYGDENTLEVYVHYLRLKRGDTDRLLIQTVRGVGYRLAAD